LIREYDQTQGAPRAISAADVFEPATPIKIRERRRPNWSAAMVLALALLVGFVVYHLVSSGKATPTSGVASQHLGTGTHTTHPRSSGATPAAQTPANEVVIHL